MFMNREESKPTFGDSSLNVSRSKNIALGFLGGIVGGVLGHVAFLWILKQGYYALILPGACVGFVAGSLVKQPSLTLGWLCALVALSFGIFSEWRWSPFTDDPRLSFFLTHLHKLKPITWIMIILGAVFGFWFSFGRKKMTV